MATLTPNHAAQMRETFLSVTAGHRIAFKDTEGFHQDLLDDALAVDLPREYPSLLGAASIKRQAIATTANLMARLFPKAVA